MSRRSTDSHELHFYENTFLSVVLFTFNSYYSFLISRQTNEKEYRDYKKLLYSSLCLKKKKKKEEEEKA